MGLPRLREGESQRQPKKDRHVSCYWVCRPWEKKEISGYKRQTKDRQKIDKRKTKDREDIKIEREVGNKTDKRQTKDREGI